ncbi:IS256 family transposase [Legionella septentrionalis]|uniref:IS256 family transposase n=1 Tax=Legionella septentrionalis TaxID=2498109 RepID=UPI000F8C7C5C|nr:IS256 family transposase [Legionella septentrionalis]RUR10071.1 IS256 family transposase [Legionella septentrionalis]
MNPELIEELARSIKTEKDLAALSKQLMKLTVERAMHAELDEHLGYEKHSVAGINSGNSRNGYSSKTLKSQFGEVEIETPRDRNSTFEPQIIRKGQTRVTGLDEQILALYAKGMTTRDIASTFKGMYDADVSHTLISKVTEAVIEEVTAWQARPLEEVYPIIYLDCIVVKCHQEKRVINKSIYLALAINMAGQKELLGLWIAENEGAKFWLSVLTELNQRGIRDIFIACVDGLTGFPEAINTVFPKTKIQLCIVHLVRNSLRFVPHKDMKAVAADLKAIYRSVTLDQAEVALLEFGEKWDKKYPAISRSWNNHWPNIATLFAFPEEIRKIIYTTNAIESLNSVIRKAINNRKIFPNDRSALKVVYLATQKASQKWTMSLRDWRSAMNRFAIEFEGRIPV